MATQTPAGNPLKALTALSWNQRISLLVLSAAVIAGVAGLVYFMNQEEYQTLYFDLGTDEAAQIVDRLKALKIPYKVSDSGRSIMTPAANISELRLQLASEGLQGGKVGFEIFDRTNLGMTEFAERVSYQRALIGELTRTIMSLKEISEARVHLTLPKESLFNDNSEAPKASVVLKLKSGKQLGAPVVSGIVHLVSSAVEGLNPENVTVVDFNGRVLSESKATTEEALTSAQMELKARTEKDLTAKIVNILEPVVGAERVKADTSVVMDFSRREQTEEKYDPQSVIRNQTTSQEQNQTGPGVSVGALGIPGTKSNGADPSPQLLPAVAGGSSYTKQSETKNYEISKLVRHTLEPTATIQRLSVAVIVDDAVQMDKDPSGAPLRKNVPRSADDLKKIKDLVTAAVGIDAGRGDVLTIENIAFEAPAEPDDAPAGFLPEVQTLARPAMRYTSLLALFLLVYFLLFRPISKRVFVSVDETLGRPAAQLSDGAEAGPSLSLATPKTVKELEASLGEGRGQPALAGSDVNRTDILKQRIAEFVQREPEKGAQLVRSWLTEGGKG